MVVHGITVRADQFRGEPTGYLVVVANTRLLGLRSRIGMEDGVKEAFTGFAFLLQREVIR